MHPGIPEFNKVIRQRSADGEYRYEYGLVNDSSMDPSLDPINVPLTFTRVYYPNDHYIEYWCNDQGNVVRRSENIIGIFGIPVEIIYGYRYNEDSRVVEESLPSGDTMKYYYQRDLYADIHNGDTFGATPSDRLAFGNLLRTTESPRAGTSEERRIVTEYDYFVLPNRLKSIRGPYYADPILLNPIPEEKINEIIYQYDGHGNLEEIIYPDVERPDGTIQHLETKKIIYNNYGLITDVINGSLHTKYTYFPETIRSGYIQEIVEDADAIKVKTQCEVDDLGRVTQIKNHFGAIYKMEWTTFDTIKTLILPQVLTGTIEPKVMYEYDKNRQLVLATEEIRLYDGSQHPNGSYIQKFIRDLLRSNNRMGDQARRACQNSIHG